MGEFLAEIGIEFQMYFNACDVGGELSELYNIKSIRVEYTFQFTR